MVCWSHMGEADHQHVQQDEMGQEEEESPQSLTRKPHKCAEMPSNQPFSITFTQMALI